MRTRCFNEKHNRFCNYGGRGITVCDRWLSFDNFMADMGPSPPGTSIDRIDNDGHYEPGNCRWATRSEQMVKTSRTIFIATDSGPIPIATFAATHQVSIQTIRYRHLHGLDLLKKSAQGRPRKPSTPI